MRVEKTRNEELSTGCALRIARYPFLVTHYGITPVTRYSSSPVTRYFTPVTRYSSSPVTRYSPSLVTRPPQ